MKSILYAALFFFIGFQNANSQQLRSPNGNFIMEFALQNDGTPTYNLTYKGKIVVKPSKLGLELKEDKNIKKSWIDKKVTVDFPCRMYYIFNIKIIQTLLNTMHLTQTD